MEDELRFTKLMESILNRHGPTLVRGVACYPFLVSKLTLSLYQVTMAKGFVELRERLHIGPTEPFPQEMQDLVNILDVFYTSRVGIRTLMGKLNSP